MTCETYTTDEMSGASSPANATPFGVSNDPLTDLKQRISDRDADQVPECHNIPA